MKVLLVVSITLLILKLTSSSPVDLTSANEKTKVVTKTLNFIDFIFRGDADGDLKAESFGKVTSKTSLNDSIIFYNDFEEHLPAAEIANKTISTTTEDLFPLRVDEIENPEPMMISPQLICTLCG